MRVLGTARVSTGVGRAPVFFDMPVLGAPAHHLRPVEVDDEAVIDFHRYPDADYAVPTPDHFLPLLYILGASKGETPRTFNNVRNLGSMALTGYAFGL